MASISAMSSSNFCTYWRVLSLQLSIKKMDSRFLTFIFSLMVLMSPLSYIHTQPYQWISTYCMVDLPICMLMVFDSSSSKKEYLYRRQLHSLHVKHATWQSQPGWFVKFSILGQLILSKKSILISMARYRPWALGTRVTSYSLPMTSLATDG